MHNRVVPILFVCFVLLFSANYSLAQESNEELAQAAANPLADLISFPLQNNLDFGLGEYDRSRNVLNIQPVIPLAGGKIITRIPQEKNWKQTGCLLLMVPSMQY